MTFEEWEEWWEGPGSSGISGGAYSTRAYEKATQMAWDASRSETLEEVAKMLEAKAEDDGGDSGVCLYWAYRLRMMKEGK
jgi:hypothetical protein